MTKKPFIIGIFIGTVLLFSFLYTFPDGKLHLVFCNVGQGDSAYIRTPSNQDILIDAGPDEKVLSCLGRHMPFYDRTIDIVVLSHPQKDHYSGLISVFKRYQVKNAVIDAAVEDSPKYQELLDLIKSRNIPLKVLFQGDQFSLGQVKFSVLWPQKQWVTQNSSLSTLASSNTSQVLGISTSRDTNDFSYYLHLSYGTFDALFTGDGDNRIQPEIMHLVNLPDVEVLKFPHHGSKYGVLEDFLDQVKPELAVISVGKNPWGHPTQEALEQLNKRAIKIKRTDKDGDVEIVSNGKSWSY